MPKKDKESKKGDWGKNRFRLGRGSKDSTPNAKTAAPAPSPPLPASPPPSDLDSNGGGGGQKAENGGVVGAPPGSTGMYEDYPELGGFAVLKVKGVSSPSPRGSPLIGRGEGGAGGGGGSRIPVANGPDHNGDVCSPGDAPMVCTCGPSPHTSPQLSPLHATHPYGLVKDRSHESVRENGGVGGPASPHSSSCASPRHQPPPSPRSYGPMSSFHQGDYVSLRNGSPAAGSPPLLTSPGHNPRGGGGGSPGLGSRGGPDAGFPSPTPLAPPPQPQPLSVVAVIEHGARYSPRPPSGPDGSLVSPVRPKTLPTTSPPPPHVYPSPSHHPVPTHAPMTLGYSRGGDESPSSQSMTSVVSVIAAGYPDGGGGGATVAKQTLGEILQQIEMRSKSLQRRDDFTVPDPHPDLTYLAHQSRYSSDVHIKRRLIAKLVESRCLEIFLRVFHSVHTVDYLALTLAGENGGGGGGGGSGRRRSEGGVSVDTSDYGGSGGCVGVARETTSDAAASAAAVTQGDDIPMMDKDADNPPGTAATTAEAPDVVSGMQTATAGMTTTTTSHFHSRSKESLNSEHALISGGGDGSNSSPAPSHKSSSGGSGVTDALRNLRAAITLMWNATDKSPFLCEECIKRGLLQLLLRDLGDPQLANSDLRDHNQLYVVKGYLGILNNVVRFYNDAREIFREAGALKVLQPYVRSQLLLVKTKTIILLSYIINESENDVINATDKNTGFVVKMLETALENDNHYSKKYNYWAVEIAAGLNRLGCFETNKERIVKRGALPLYLKMLQSSCSDDEQLIAAQGLWVFAYSPQARDVIREDIPTLEALHNLTLTAERDEIKRAARGALWVIQGRTHSSGALPKSPRVHSGSGHVMICYHWASRPALVRLRERLKGQGYKVYMDTENMTTCGSPLESALEAVEKAVVVLLGMTQKYKDSPSCRNEVEYACRLRKDLIPLRLQPKYNPDGWLAQVVGSKMFFDFSREENLENMTASLVRELGSRGRSRTAIAAAAAAASGALGERPEAGRSASTQSMLSLLGVAGQQALPATPPGGAHHNFAKIARWTEEDVCYWLRECDLDPALDRFRHVNGELLLEFRRMQINAPESFYASLRNDLQFDLITQLKFTRAMERLC